MDSRLETRVMRIVSVEVRGAVIRDSRRLSQGRRSRRSKRVGVTLTLLFSPSSFSGLFSGASGRTEV